MMSRSDVVMLGVGLFCFGIGGVAGWLARRYDNFRHQSDPTITLFQRPKTKQNDSKIT